MRSSAAAPLRHALVVVAGYSALFTWLFSQPIVHGTYMAEGDLYDWFLPIFLSPISAWSHDMFGGLPLFADTSDSQAYVFHFLFAHVLHSWTGYIICAYVLGSAFTYAYVFTLTRSKTAAAFSGLAFGLSHAMLEKQAQINIVHCTAWFPLMALAIDRLATRRVEAMGWRSAPSPPPTAFSRVTRNRSSTPSRSAWSTRLPVGLANARPGPFISGRSACCSSRSP